MHQYVANKLIEVNNNKLIIEVNKTLSAAKRLCKCLCKVLQMSATCRSCIVFALVRASDHTDLYVKVTIFLNDNHGNSKTVQDQYFNSRLIRSRTIIYQMVPLTMTLTLTDF